MNFKANIVLLWVPFPEEAMRPEHFLVCRAL
nr:MAG TPA: hypothetical protein [Caudoviricetes sp.]